MFYNGTMTITLPANLKHLTTADVVAIDACIDAVAKHGHGKVTIVIKDGKARFVEPSPSLALGRGVEIKTGPL